MREISVKTEWNCIKLSYLILVYYLVSMWWQSNKTIYHEFSAPWVLSKTTKGRYADKIYAREGKLETNTKIGLITSPVGRIRNRDTISGAYLKYICLTSKNRNYYILFFLCVTAAIYPNMYINVIIILVVFQKIKYVCHVWALGL